MTQINEGSQSQISHTKHQEIFVRLFTAVLIDLVVLNLLDEFWDKVVINSFLISLLAALLLQVLLRVTIGIEHRISAFFNKKSGGFNKLLKILSLWAVLFGSKFAILGAIDFAFGEEVLFLGKYHGIITFIVVIIVILLAENLVGKFNRWLGIIGKES